MERLVSPWLLLLTVLATAQYSLAQRFTYPEIPDLNIPEESISQGETFLEEKCRLVGGEDAVKIATAARIQLQECVLSLVNYTVLKAEIEEAMPTGELDGVFKRYCRMLPKFHSCAENFTRDIDVCLKKDELRNKETIYDITKTTANFVCHKEGDRIALFIAEGGPECWSDSQEGIQDCVNETMTRHVPEDVSLDDLKNVSTSGFLFGREECTEIFNLKNCIVRNLEKCKQPTPANILDSMFKFIWKSTPCAKYEPRETQQNPSASETSSSLSVKVLQTLLVLGVSVSIVRTRVY